MKNYVWSGLNSEQQKTTGKITASSLALAKMQLKRQGIFLHSIRRKRPSIFFRKDKINFYDRVLLCRQLAVLIEAGIAITDSFDILSKKQEKMSLQNFLVTIKHKLETGKKLAESLRFYPEYFDDLSCHLIEIGEHTGQLDKMLIKIANNQEKKWHIRQQIKAVLFYPVIILFVSVVISLIMLIFIVPRFEELFSNFQRQLPALTLGIFLISKWIRHFFAIGILLFSTGLVFLIYCKKTLKNYLDTILQKWPLLKNLTQKILLARFAHNLALTVSAGMVITDALKMMIHTKPSLYSNAIQHLHREISMGQQIHKSMETHPLFSPMMIQMVKVGEETGKLDPMLEKIALLYEAEISQWLQQFSRLLEPLIMLILGVLIGGLVIAMYLPIFKLGTVVNGHY